MDSKERMLAEGIPPGFRSQAESNDWARQRSRAAHPEPDDDEKAQAANSDLGVIPAQMDGLSSALDQCADVFAALEERLGAVTRQTVSAKMDAGKILAQEHSELARAIGISRSRVYELTDRMKWLLEHLEL